MVTKRIALVTGELEKPPPRTTALAFGPQPWTYASASPAMKVEEVPLYGRHRPPREGFPRPPEPDFADSVASSKTRIRHWKEWFWLYRRATKAIARHRP